MDSHIATALARAANCEGDFDVPPAVPSDYGSDIDLDDIPEDTVVEFAAAAPNETAYGNIESETQHVGVATDKPSQYLVRGAALVTETLPVVASDLPLGFDRQSSSRRALSVPRESSPVHMHLAPEPGLPADDSRSPLERFRLKPKKPLSVTDLVSPAWCELQYSYTLSKFGRKPRTQAMKTGSKIHQALEDEIHVAIPIDTVSKEDRFGLRIWNVIQGLRCLRETGLTRELEIWGVIDGQVVNGVIDEVSFACPDLDMEEGLGLSGAEQSDGTLPPGQLSIERAFNHVSNGTLIPEAVERKRPVYIADVKTRGARSLPKGASLRPTWMQLMLYRKLLESLSSNTVDADTIFARYGLAPLDPFSEAFVRGCSVFGVVDSESDVGDADSLLHTNELTTHSNLSALWSLMITEYQHVMPSISDLLRAEFRYAKNGEVIGSELMKYNADTIDAYVRSEMEWWLGQREAQGVEIEEAFKCRMCDFADECTWRKTKIEEATEKSRMKREARESNRV